MIVRAASRMSFPWIEQRASLSLGKLATAIEAVDDNGRIQGMVAYDNWTPNSVMAHVALESAGAGKASLGPAFQYPFIELNRKLMIGIVRSSKEKALKLDLHLGFEVTHIIKDGWADGEDLIVLEMPREKCRYLNLRRKVA